MTPILNNLGFKLSNQGSAVADEGHPLPLQSRINLWGPVTLSFMLYAGFQLQLLPSGALAKGSLEASS